MNTVLMTIGEAVVVIGIVGNILLHLGTSKQERYNVDKMNLDPKTKLRIKLGYWVGIGGVALGAIFIFAASKVG